MSRPAAARPVSSVSPLPRASLIWLAAWLSAAILAYEIALMRVLLVASWHHFAFLVISLVLLGFGASGTALTFVRGPVLRRPRTALLAATLATAVTMPLCTSLSQHVPIEARFVPALLWRQLGAWTACFGLLFVPFFFGAFALGAALMAAGPRIAAVYGANLLGSAAGAALAPLVMAVLAPGWLAVGLAPLALVGLLPLRRGPLAAAGGCALIAAATALDPPRLRLDPYKYGAYVRRLVEQGAASRVAAASGPRGLLEAYRSDALHDMPFLGVGATPPSLTAIVIDGHWAGSLLDVGDAGDAAAVDQTLMAAAYALAPPRPRVALLGEIGGSNAWLARRAGAASIDVVQPHAALDRMLRGPLRDLGGSVLEAEGVRTAVREPRHVVEHGRERYDLVQLVALEGSAAGSGGIGGLGQDHLVTVEGFSACLRSLGEDGVLVMCRGIQTPPRDNVKLLATIAAALRRAGIERPGPHVVVVRDYLAVCTMVRPRPWGPDSAERVRALCRDRQLTPVWFEGVREEELNRPDALPGPETGGDWYHHAARELLGDEARARTFVERWHFDVRPPTDDRPFFLDFCRLRSLGALRDAFGEQWLARSELAFPFVLGASALIAIAGAVLIVVPLPVLAPAARRGRTVTGVYFASIGLAYLLLEVTFLGRVVLLVGDPVTTAALIIGGFLCFSGLGALAAQRWARPAAGPVRLLFAGLIGSAAVALLLLPALVHVAGPWPLAARAAIAVVLIGVPAFLMGFPMPLALARLERDIPALIPWAWGINGFASVLAAPLTTVLGMTFGFTAAAILALALYAAAGMVGRAARA